MKFKEWSKYPRPGHKPGDKVRVQTISRAAARKHHHALKGTRPASVLV